MYRDVTCSASRLDSTPTAQAAATAATHRLVLSRCKQNNQAFITGTHTHIYNIYTQKQEEATAAVATIK